MKSSSILRTPRLQGVLGILPQQVAPPLGFSPTHLQGLPLPPPLSLVPPPRPYTAAGATLGQDTEALGRPIEPWLHSSHNLATASTQVTNLQQILSLCLHS